MGDGGSRCCDGLVSLSLRFGARRRATEQKAGVETGGWLLLRVDLSSTGGKRLFCFFGSLSLLREKGLYVYVLMVGKRKRAVRRERRVLGRTSAARQNPRCCERCRCRSGTLRCVRRRRLRNDKRMAGHRERKAKRWGPILGGHAATQSVRAVSGSGARADGQPSNAATGTTGVPVWGARAHCTCSRHIERDAAESVATGTATRVCSMGDGCVLLFFRQGGKRRAASLLGSPTAVANLVAGRVFWWPRAQQGGAQGRVSSRRAQRVGAAEGKRNGWGNTYQSNGARRSSRGMLDAGRGRVVRVCGRAMQYSLYEVRAETPHGVDRYLAARRSVCGCLQSHSASAYA